MRKALTIIVCLLITVSAGGYAAWELGLKYRVYGVISTIAERQRGTTYREVVSPRHEGDGIKVWEPAFANMEMPTNFGAYRDPIMDEIEAMRLDVVKRLIAHDFSGLDAIADEARTKRIRFGTGSWKIAQFYSALTMNRNADESAWQERLATLREWQQQQPLSTTARVALADALTDYAWKARGIGLADEVGEEGWELFGKRLMEALKVLGEARKLPAKDPYWWYVSQTVALGQDWPREAYENLFQEAVEFEPEYWGFYAQKAKYLLPRWSGEPGEWERFAEESIKAPNGLGPEIYARIVMPMSSYYKNIFQDSNARWDLAKAGFEKIRERYPDSTEMLAQFAMMAGRGRDVLCSQEMFKALGDRIDVRVWGTQERYRSYWVYAHSTLVLQRSPKSNERLRHPPPAR